MRKNTNINQIFWGLAILVVGVLFLAQNLGFLDDFPFWNYLPALLILLGVYQLVSNQFRAWVGPLIVILAGSYLLMTTLGFISWSTFGKLIWPTALILIGISFIFRSNKMGRDYAADSNSQFNTFAIFGGQERRVNSPDFQIGEASTIFGGVELDLREARIVNPPARLQVSAIFGGIDIQVPAEWDVRVDVVALFGGTDDKRRSNAESKQTPDLIISGTVLFGGMEVKS